MSPWRARAPQSTCRSRSRARSDPGPFAGTIDIGSGNAPVGKGLAIRGSGFTAGQTAAIELRGKKGEKVSLGTVKVAADGTFSASPVVPKSTQPGKYTLAVTLPNGDEATATVHVNRGN